MNYRIDIADKELPELLRGRRFRPGEGAMFPGKNLALQCVPWQEGTLRMCNLEVRILPYAPASETLEAVREAQEDACRDLLKDPDPNVRAAAAAALENLKKPPVPQGALEGIAIEFTQVTRRATTVRLRGITDSNGRTTLEHVLMDAPCSLALAAPPTKDGLTRGRGGDVFEFLPPRPRGSVPLGSGAAEPSEPGESLALSAPANEEVWLSAAPAPVGPLTPIDAVATERITATFERDKDGVVWLAVFSADATLAEATVAWRCGAAHGSLKLLSDNEGGWQGVCRLGLAEQELKHVTFAVEPIGP